MADGELRAALQTAYDAAGHVKNPWFELPEPAVGVTEEPEIDLAQAANALAAGLFGADEADAFVNSAEVFAIRKMVRIVSSRGTDARYMRQIFKGEFVAQCVTPDDVELYGDFEYDAPDVPALSRAAGELVAAARDRARAADAPKAGKYAMILEGKHLSTLFSAYLEKAAAPMVYAKYSNYEIGASAQGADVRGDKIDMSLRAREPFSDEGIPMRDRALIENGTLKQFYGSTRFCRYLGIEPTGVYRSVRVDNGSVSHDEMKKRPHIRPVAFSDFQMDPFSGHFGGEIRLAYVFDGEKTRVVTGGSVNGSLFEAQGNLTFSTERYRDADYEGPLAALLSNVMVAGESDGT
jgi:predicted Zn-dependent protease